MYTFRGGHKYTHTHTQMHTYVEEEFEMSPAFKC